MSQTVLPRSAFCFAFFVAVCVAGPPAGWAECGRTSLTDTSVKFVVSQQHFAVLTGGPVRAVIVDNAAVDNDILPGHRAGYSGIASLTHEQQPRNIFVPRYAGVNFEHIHDGVTDNLKEKFEPRKAPMRLRMIDEATVELYQPPTPHFQLESCGRYHLRVDGVIEYSFECIPKSRTFQRGFVGLFWASYIDQPRDKAIHFLGRRREAAGAPPSWIVGRTPQHGVNASHPPVNWPMDRVEIDTDFPLTLVNHPSPYEHTDDWYFGVCRGMAYAQIFERDAQVHFAQSPSGGGDGNSAWDFQWFIPNAETNQSYGFKMQLLYLPFTSKQAMAKKVQRLRGVKSGVPN